MGGMTGERLSRSFYNRGAEQVARDLLGCWLVHREPRGGRLVTGRIVETEAYMGEADRACHAHAGRTARNAVMYGPPGHAYVFFVYGMHDMMNVVCRPEGCPEAVLIRALEPGPSVEAMRRRRPGVLAVHDLASGPGKLCRALGITRELNGADLCGGRLWIVRGDRLPGERVRRGPRIGVHYAGIDAKRPLRFWLAGNPHVSRPR
jgi:DNA-3-methyladenine glycosylase